MTHDELTKGTHYFCDRPMKLIPAADQQPKKKKSLSVLDAAILSAKLDKAVDKIQRLAATASHVTPAQSQSVRPVVRQSATTYQQKYERICAESQAAYDACNPHKKEGV